jgi:hypothetical protein
MMHLVDIKGMVRISIFQLYQADQIKYPPGVKDIYKVVVT